MTKFVRVFMPVDSPKGTLDLCKDIFIKHTDMGVGSPLTGFVDMADFNTKTTNAGNLHKSGTTHQRDAQGFYNTVETALGWSKQQNRQTPGTVINFVIKVRDVLLLKYRGTEELMEAFGFNVVISNSGARKYVRVTIPENKPADLLELADDIIEKDTELGGASPLVGNVDMVAFAALVTSANGTLAQWTEADADAQADHNDALALFGYAAGQTSETAGTLYYDLGAIRDRLLSFYEGTEEQLSRWGFEVVISETSTKLKTGSRSGKIASLASLNVDISQLTVVLETKFQLKSTGDTPLHYYFSETPGGAPTGSPIIVAPGQTLTRTAAELGLSISRVYFTVHNPGEVEGRYRARVGV